MSDAHDGTGRVELSFTVLDADPERTAQRTVRVPPGVTVFDSASWNGIAIDSTCGGHGTCHKCKVRVEGTTPITRHDLKTFSREQLDDGWRLACLVNATRDLAVDVPPLTTRPKAATVGVGRQVILRPAIQKRYVELDEPTLTDQRTDLDRLLQAIDDLEPVADLHLLRRLPTVLRAADFKVTAVVVDEALIDVEPGDTTKTQYAIAFDLGTTTVVATLLDVATGTPVAVASMLNKQQPFGGDVITRISATMMDPEALGRLQRAAAETLSTLAIQVCTEGGVDPAHVYEVAIAGNATMTALLLGHRPRAARRRAVHHVVAAATGPAGLRARAGPAPPGPGHALPRTRGVRRRRHRRRHARLRHGPRQAHPPLHRRRHQLRDRAQRRRPDPLDGRTRRPGVRGWRDPLRDARGRRRDRGREAGRGRRRARRHRRRRAARSLRFRARRRGRRAGEGRTARRVGPLRRRRRRQGGGPGPGRPAHHA